MPKASISERREILSLVLHLHCNIMKNRDLDDLEAMFNKCLELVEKD